MSQTDLPPKLAEILAAQGLFQDKYRLKRRLGEGSFAFVIQAKHEAMGRDVALKFLRPDVVKAHPEVSKRFLLEVKLASRLTSPNTVTIFDFGETDEEIPFMVLEYVKGKTLDHAIEKYGALGLKRSLRIAMQILDSLEEAHALHIIHRDLKPANIIVGRAPTTGKVTAKVLDFGVAKLVEKAEGEAHTKSGRQSTQFIGTPRYMSPEQILGQKVSAASDLYSLGLILYEMATGEDCIAEESVGDVARIHLEDGPLPLRSLDELPTPLQEVILRATSRHPEDRYPDAARFREALERVIEEGKSRSQQATRKPSAPKRPKRFTPSKSDVFSGKGYVALPEDSEAGVVRTPSSAASGPQKTLSSGPQRTLSSGPQRTISAGLGEEEEPSARPRRPKRLTLDMELARSVDAKRRQAVRQDLQERQRAEKQEVRKVRWPLWLGSVVGLLISGYLGVVWIGGAFGMLATPMRVGAALLPLLFGLLWAVFSQNAYPDLLRRRIAPWAKRSAMMILISVVFIGLVMPGAAEASLKAETLWFLELVPEDLGPVAAVEGVSKMLSQGLAQVLGHLDRILPWT